MTSRMNEPMAIRMKNRVILLALIFTLGGLLGCQRIGEDVSAAPASEHEEALQTADSPEPSAEATEAAAAPDEPAEPEAEPAEPAAIENAVREIAAYNIPDSSTEAVGRLVLAIADHPGLVSADCDEESSQLRVTFTAGATNPDNILTALTQIEPAVSFAGVTRAAGSPEPRPGHNCGSCPRRHQCGQ